MLESELIGFRISKNPGAADKGPQWSRFKITTSTAACVTVSQVPGNIYTSAVKCSFEMWRNNTRIAEKKMYDEQYVSAWHEDMQSACMTGTFMPDCIEGIS